MEPFRSLYPDLSAGTTRFIPEFEVLMLHLAKLSPETILAFQQYGTLRAGMLAMKHAHNKRFLKQYFPEIFVFLERHPEKTALRNQLLTYLIGGSNLTREELNDLLQAVLYKPYYENLKSESMEISEGFIAVAARETEERVRKEEQQRAQEAKIAAEKKLQAERLARLAEVQLTKRSLMMRLWHKKVATEVIADATELPLAEVEKLVKGFEAAQMYLLSAGKKVSNKKVIELTGLTADEAAVLIKVLKPSQIS